jgi:hypothetical protein
VGAVVLEGDGLAGSVGVFHAFSSTQRCSRRVCIEAVGN